MKYLVIEVPDTFDEGEQTVFDAMSEGGNWIATLTRDPRLGTRSSSPRSIIERDIEFYNDQSETYLRQRRVCRVGKESRYYALAAMCIDVARSLSFLRSEMDKP